MCSGVCDDWRHFAAAAAAADDDDDAGELSRIVGPCRIAGRMQSAPQQ